MNIPNDKLIASYRTAGPCENCGASCSMRCAAHVFSKGAGKVDHPLNIVHLGMHVLRDCPCHHNSHANGRPSRDDFLAIVSERENIPVWLISQSIQAVRACPRKSTFHAASLWLRQRFEREVADGAIKIITDSGIYK